MAGETRNRVKLFAVAVLFLCAQIPICAQSGGSLTGKLTDLHSYPLAGATVVLRNQSTNEEIRTITAKDGVYRFSSLQAGRYSLEADSPQLGHAQLNGIQVSAGYEAHVQTAVQFDLAPSVPVHSVFLESPRPIPPPQLHPMPTLAAALPHGQSIPTATATLSIMLSLQAPRLLPSSARPVPVIPHDPPPTQTALLTVSLPPTPRPALLIALPASELPAVAALHPATVTALPTPGLAAALTGVHTHPGIPHLPAIASVANGLLAAAQWSVPRSIPIQAASQRDDPASPAVATALTANELQSLPATGRRWEEFALDTPAATDGSAGDNRICGLGSDKVSYDVGRNTYRYPFTWKADMRLAKQFDLGHMRQLQLLAESFNLFNHQNVTQVETTGYTISPGTLAGAFPTLTFLTGLKANTTAFGQPRAVNATNYYRERQIQFGLRMRF